LDRRSDAGYVIPHLRRPERCGGQPSRLSIKPGVGLADSSSAGDGQFNITGTTYGVVAWNGTAAVTNATATGASGIGAYAGSGGSVLLDKEAQELTNAARYERTEARQGYRAGHYDRNLTATSGDVTLKVPKLKGVPFETAIIERYRRRESSVEEALIEMYLAGVSVRRVEDITEALWGTKVSPSTISELNKKAYVHIEEWRNRPLRGGK
jgi:hypothetical protein